MIGTEREAVNARKGSAVRFVFFASFLSLAALGVLFIYGRTMLSGDGPVGGGPAAQGERGPILDRNGKILAMQTKLGNVTIWKPELREPEETVEKLSGILGMKAEALKERIAASESDFLYVKKKVDQSAIAAIEALRAAGELKGVGIEPTVGRVYPEKSLASKLVGFVGDDNIGLAGTEYAFQNALAPADGSGYGDQVFLTIDANAQHLVEKITRASFEANKAEAVLSIALDPRTGEILAYANMPDYDPNDIRSFGEREMTDRIAVNAYEPGSVFKIFSLSAMMELGGITASSTFVCDGAYDTITAGGERIVIKCLGAHGTVHPKEIIKYSCNTGTAYASDTVEAAAFARMIENFGFGAKTGSGLPGETPGFVRPVDRWSQRSKQTIAIGQEIAVSALQMVQAATAIANDGVMVRPRYVSRIVAPDGTVKQVFDPEPIRRVISAANAREMRSFMMAASSEAGTGHRANVEDMRLAVKTGTAQLIDPETNAYSKTDYIASCMALLPEEAPRLVLYHVIIKPKGDSYLGGRIAAPPIREMAEALTDYFGIPRGRNEQAVHSGTVTIPAAGDVSIGDHMPNLVGASKRSLLPLLSRSDISVEIVGDGWVRRQSPAAGAPISAGAKIRLELE